jgi:hypothetical protein
MTAGLSTKANGEATQTSRHPLTPTLNLRGVRRAGPVWAPDPWGSGTPDCRCELFPAGGRA